MTPMRIGAWSARASPAVCALVVVALTLGPHLQPFPAGAAGPSLRGISTAAANSTVFTVQAPGAIAAGDVLIAALQLNGTGAITAPGGWNLIGSTASGADVTASYVKVAGSGEPASYT